MLGPPGDEIIERHRLRWEVTVTTGCTRRWVIAGGAACASLLLGAAAQAEEQRIRDDYGRVIQVRDPAGRETRYDYGEDGRLVAMATPEGGVVTYVYDEHGRWLGTRDPNGRFEAATGSAPSRPE